MLQRCAALRKLTSYTKVRMAERHPELAIGPHRLPLPLLMYVTCTS